MNTYRTRINFVFQNKSNSIKYTKTPLKLAEEDYELDKFWKKKTLSAIKVDQNVLNVLVGSLDENEDEGELMTKKKGTKKGKKKVEKKKVELSDDEPVVPSKPASKPNTPAPEGDDENDVAVSRKKPKKKKKKADDSDSGKGSQILSPTSRAVASPPDSPNSPPRVPQIATQTGSASVISTTPTISSVSSSPATSGNSPAVFPSSVPSSPIPTKETSPVASKRELQEMSETTQHENTKMSENKLMEDLQTFEIDELMAAVITQSQTTDDVKSELSEQTPSIDETPRQMSPKLEDESQKTTPEETEKTVIGQDKEQPQEKTTPVEEPTKIEEGTEQLSNKNEEIPQNEDKTNGEELKKLENDTQKPTETPLSDSPICSPQKTELSPDLSATNIVEEKIRPEEEKMAEIDMSASISENFPNPTTILPEISEINANLPSMDDIRQELDVKQDFNNKLNDILDEIPIPIHVHASMQDSQDFSSKELMTEDSNSLQNSNSEKSSPIGQEISSIKIPTKNPNTSEPVEDISDDKEIPQELVFDDSNPENPLQSASNHNILDDFNHVLLSCGTPPDEEADFTPSQKHSKITEGFGFMEDKSKTSNVAAKEIKERILESQIFTDNLNKSRNLQKNEINQKMEVQTLQEILKSKDKEIEKMKKQIKDLKSKKALQMKMVQNSIKKSPLNKIESFKMHKNMNYTEILPQINDLNATFSTFNADFSQLIEKIIDKNVRKGKEKEFKIAIEKMLQTKYFLKNSIIRLENVINLISINPPMSESDKLTPEDLQKAQTSSNIKNSPGIDKPNIYFSVDPEEILQNQQDMLIQLAILSEKLHEKEKVLASEKERLLMDWNNKNNLLLAKYQTHELQNAGKQSSNSRHNSVSKHSPTSSKAQGHKSSLFSSPQVTQDPAQQQSGNVPSPSSGQQGGDPLAELLEEQKKKNEEDNKFIIDDYFHESKKESDKLAKKSSEKSEKSDKSSEKSIILSEDTAEDNNKEIEKKKSKKRISVNKNITERDDSAIVEDDLEDFEKVGVEMGVEEFEQDDKEGGPSKSSEQEQQNQETESQSDNSTSDDDSPKTKTSSLKSRIQPDERYQDEMNRIQNKLVLDLPRDNVLSVQYRNKVFAQQKGLCEGCGKPLKNDYGFLQKPRMCSYTNKFYCKNCHQNEEFIIPSNVIHKWDFKNYKVCETSYAFLRSIYSKPCIYLSTENVTLYDTIKNLQTARSIRKRLLLLWGIVFNCPNKEKIMKKLCLYDVEKYVCVTDTEIYSLKNLKELSMNYSPCIKELLSMHQFFKDHITNKCEHCKKNCFSCTICEKGPIFLFEKRKITICSQCNSVFHTNCFQREVSCPVCAQKNQKSPTAIENSKKKTT